VINIVISFTVIMSIVVSVFYQHMAMWRSGNEDRRRASVDKVWEKVPHNYVSGLSRSCHGHTCVNALCLLL